MKRKTRREVFLERMDKLIPWTQLEKKVARYYLKGQNGQPPYSLSAMEDALYEIESMRHFADMKLDRLPDETTILNFRHFLEQHRLGKALFKEVNKHLEKNGLILREGSIGDAAIIFAPPQLHQEQYRQARPHRRKCTRSERATNGTLA